MKNEIRIPQMGESITEATIGKFLKASGEQVKENDEIVELETEKVNQVLYASSSGIINWQVKEGENVKVGELIGMIESELSFLQEKPQLKQSEKKEKLFQEDDLQSRSNGSGKRIFTEDFVQEIKQSSAPSVEKPIQKESDPKNERETRRPLTNIRKTISNRLVEALHSTAMLTTFNEIDMSEIMALREKYKSIFIEKHGVKLGFMSFFVKAVVEALKAFPDFNSYLDKGEIVTRHYYNLGIAVGTEHGLVVPVIKECDQRSFAEIEQEIIHFAKKAREKKLSLSDLEGGGFTITNGGVYGSLLSTPILNPPQVGILGMHKIMQRPIVVNNHIVIRSMMYVALSYDHRVVDGKEAVSFLVYIKEILEEPSRFYL